MERRVSIKYISKFLSLAVSLPSFTAMVEGCSAKKKPEWAPLIISERQRTIIDVLSDRIVPPTDTAGAVDAGVPMFIEILLKDVFPLRDTRELLTRLEEFNLDCKHLVGKEFSNASVSQQNEWLIAVSDGAHKHHDLFIKMKKLVVSTYFTSEKGMKQGLNYVPIPKKFEGCIPENKHPKLMVGDRI